VDIVPWPVEFDDEDMALESYNGFGLWHKIQFKLMSLTRNSESGVVHGFTLACSRRGCCNKNTSIGNGATSGTSVSGQILQLRDSGEVPCPVTVRFRWNSVKKKFRRVSKLVMHHGHDLELKEGASLSNKRIYNEVRVYVESGLPTAQVHTLI